jgi:hypothetical protein
VTSLTSSFADLEQTRGVVALADREGPTVRLSAVGDFDFHAETYAALMARGPRHLFAPVLPLLAPADLRIGNLETVLLSSPYTPIGPRAFLISDRSAIEGLQLAGFDVLTFANNHTMDGGDDGLRECLQAIRDAGMQTAGAGLDLAQARVPARVVRKGLNFRCHAYSFGTGQIAGPRRAGCLEATPAAIRRDLEEFRNDGDIVVVSLHMDAEFQPAPAPDRVKLCRQLADLGVHLILCHHPHVAQGLEFYHGALIAYSLGNFVTPISTYMLQRSSECQYSFLLNVDVDRLGVRRAEVVPVILDDEGRPVPATGDDRDGILRLVGERSRIVASAAEVRAHYRRMIREFTGSTIKNLLWGLAEGDWPRVRAYVGAMGNTPVKRRWVRDFLFGFWQI